MSHTPGPWVSMDGCGVYDHAVIRAQDDDGEPCAGAPVAYPPPAPFGENWAADSRLIAAAPSLLDACRKALVILEAPRVLEEDMQAAVEACRGAIGKATEARS